MNNSYLRFLNNVLSIKKSEICIPFKTKSNVSKFGLITSKTTGDIKDILNWYKKEGIDKIITNIKLKHLKYLLEEEEYKYWDEKVILLNLDLKKNDENATHDYLFITDGLSKVETKIIESIKNMLNINIVDINSVENIEVLQNYLSESKRIITSLNCELLNNEIIIFAHRYDKGFHFLKTETPHCPVTLFLNGVSINPIESTILHSNFSLRKSIEIFVTQHRKNKTLIPRKTVNQTSDIYFSKIGDYSFLELSQTFDLNYIISKIESNYDFTFDYLIHTLCNLKLNQLSILLHDIKQNHIDYFPFIHDSIVQNIQHLKFICNKKLLRIFYILGYLDIYDINLIKNNPVINELKLLDNTILNYIILGTQDGNSIPQGFHKPRSEMYISTFNKLKCLAYMQLSFPSMNDPDRETQFCSLSKYLIYLNLNDELDKVDISSFNFWSLVSLLYFSFIRNNRFLLNKIFIQLRTKSIAQSMPEIHSTFHSFYFIFILIDLIENKTTASLKKLNNLCSIDPLYFSKNPCVSDFQYQSYLLLGILYILNGNEDIGNKFINNNSYNKLKLSKSNITDLVNNYSAFDSKSKLDLPIFKG